jgi:putative two-component system response regulator
MTNVTPATADVLVVDDQEQVRSVLSRILRAGGYQCRTACSVADAIAVIDEVVPDLILCDIDMPDVSGLALVEHMQDAHPDVAILMVTAFDDPAMAETAMDGGALGYIIKPFERNEILINVAGALRHRRRVIEARTTMGALQRTIADRTAELQASLSQLDQTAAALDRTHEEELRRMACAAEFRDPETACHLERMSRYAALLARALGFPDDRCEMIRLASPMHDVGKIGISDEVLLKEGIFTPDDRRAMEQHPRLGYELLTGSGSELLELAATVAYTHHEWFDGSGYPRHLAGEDIPIEGRIVAIADVYDALTSARRYKAAFAPERARELMLRESGTHFDGDLLDRFFAQAEGLARIREEWSDSESRVSVA